MPKDLNITPRPNALVQSKIVDVKERFRQQRDPEEQRKQIKAVIGPRGANLPPSTKKRVCKTQAQKQIERQQTKEKLQSVIDQIDLTSENEKKRKLKQEKKKADKLAKPLRISVNRQDLEGEMQFKSQQEDSTGSNGSEKGSVEAKVQSQGSGSKEKVEGAQSEAVQ